VIVGIKKALKNCCYYVGSFIHCYIFKFYSNMIEKKVPRNHGTVKANLWKYKLD